MIRAMPERKRFFFIEVFPKVATELKKEDITIYFDISNKRKKKKMEISDILIYHDSDGDIDEKLFLTLL